MQWGAVGSVTVWRMGSVQGSYRHRISTRSVRRRGRMSAHGWMTFMSRRFMTRCILTSPASHLAVSKPSSGLHMPIHSQHIAWLPLTAYFISTAIYSNTAFQPSKQVSNSTRLTMYRSNRCQVLFCGFLTLALQYICPQTRAILSPSMPATSPYTGWVNAKLPVGLPQ